MNTLFLTTFALFVLLPTGYSQCTSVGQSCQNQNDCCGAPDNTCIGGTCGACLDLSNQCTRNSDCCTNLCSNNVCVSCVSLGSSCSKATDCCFDSIYTCGGDNAQGNSNSQGGQFCCIKTGSNCNASTAAKCCSGRCGSQTPRVCKDNQNQQ